MSYTYEDIAGMMDHALLTPTQTDQVLDAGVLQARRYQAATVCIKPYYVARCAELLAGSETLASTVIGFPHGGHTTPVKAAEVRQAIGDGAEEVDVVVNVGKVLSGDWAYVRNDLAAMTQAARENGKLIKVIFETCFLGDEHKVRLCEICSELGVDFVKTSTGFGTGGATREDVALMRQHSAPEVQVKASGGVKSLADVLAMRDLGATRIGTSRTFALLEECRRQLGLPSLGEAGEAGNPNY